MPEVALRIVGNSASALSSVREVIGGLRDISVEEGKVATSAKAAGSTVAEQARANVARAIEQRDSLRGLVTEYGVLAKAAVAGSEEQRAASRLATEAQDQLRAAVGETTLTVEQQARVNVISAVKQRDAVLSEVEAYRKVALSAEEGSQAQIEANRLAEASAAKVGEAYLAAGEAAKKGAATAARSQSAAAEESGVARGFLSRTTGASGFAGPAFIAGAAAGLLIKKAADEANRAQESQAQLRNALEKTGQSWDRQRQSIERYLGKAEEASSFDRIDLRTSLGLLVRATGDTRKAQDLLSQATDVARGRHISLDAAVRLVTRAYQGNVGSLRRVGIDIHAVTTAQDALRAAHVKTTPEMLRQAKALDTQATATEALRILNERYSGAAEAHARTLAGHEEALGNAFTDMSVAIGQAVTPALSHMFGWMTKEVEAATHSVQLHRILHDVFHELGAIFHAVGVEAHALFVVYEAVAHLVHSQLAPAIGIGLVFAIKAAVTAMQDAEASTPWGAIAAAAFIAVTEIIAHWKTIRRWFGEFWGYMKDTGRATWELLVQLGRSAVYSILEYATAAVRGVLEVASHLPFVGDKARAALNSINDYLDKWKPDFSKVTAAFAAGGDAAGSAFNRAVARQLNDTRGYQIGKPGSDSPRQRAGATVAAGAGAGATLPGRGAHGQASGIVGVAKTQLGVPYHWGGPARLNVPTDCSGFVSAVLNANGIHVGRLNAEQLYTQAPIKNPKPLLPGDLVFYDSPHIGHVAIYLGGGQIIQDPHTGASVSYGSVNEMGGPVASARWWGPKSSPRGGGTMQPSTPSIQDIISQGTPVSAAHHAHPAAPTTLAAFGVPQGLQDAVKKAADEARNAISAGHYQAAIRFYDLERTDLEREARDLRRKLSDPKLTKAQRDAIHRDLTAVENSIRDVGASIRSAHKKIADAARAEMQKEEQELQSKVSQLQSDVSSAFSSVSSGVISAFDAQTQALVDAAGARFFQGGQTPQEAALAAARSADQAQSLQDALAQAQASGDLQQVAAAQHAIDMYNLEAAAAASRAQVDADYAEAVKKIQADRTREEEHLTADLGKFGDALGSGTVTMSDLQPLLSKYGIQLGDISDSSFTFKTNLDGLVSSAGALDTALRDLAKLISRITGKPINLPPALSSGGGGGGGAPPPTGRHGVAEFATGGIVPGPMIGPEDTIAARVSTGEGVLSRDEMRMLVAAALGPRSTAGVLSGRPIYVLGTTRDEVGRALARIVTPAQRRQVGFESY